MWWRENQWLHLYYGTDVVVMRCHPWLWDMWCARLWCSSSSCCVLAKSFLNVLYHTPSICLCSKDEHAWGLQCCTTTYDDDALALSMPVLVTSCDKTCAHTARFAGTCWAALSTTFLFSVVVKVWALLLPKVERVENHVVSPLLCLGRVVVVSIVRPTWFVWFHSL